MTVELTADVLVRLLAEPDRLQVLAAVALGASTQREIVERSGLSSKRALTALGKLLESDLLVPGSDEDGNSARVNYERLRELARTTQPAADLDDGGHVGLRPFLRGDRVVKLPAQQEKRRAVLEYVALRSFEPRRKYDEATVNDKLRDWCDGVDVDHVTLRRYLIDHEILLRARGVYGLGPLRTSTDPTSTD